MVNGSLGVSLIIGSGILITGIFAGSVTKLQVESVPLDIETISHELVTVLDVLDVLLLELTVESVLLLVTNSHEFTLEVTETAPL